MASRILTNEQIIQLVQKQAVERGIPLSFEYILINEDWGVPPRFNIGGVYTLLTVDMRVMTDEDFVDQVVTPMLSEYAKGSNWKSTNADAPGTAALLDQRGKTHGDYTHMSITIQKIKDAMGSGEAWSQCSAGQREALEMIATKIGRIVCGDPGHHDHWQDVIGYATKALERIPHAPATKD